MRKTDLVSYLQRHVLKLDTDDSLEALPVRGPKESKAKVPFSVAHHPILFSRTRRVPLTK